MSVLRVVVLGLSITSSWGNGHATNFRALVRALDARGHDVLFLERDVPWYADARDLPSPPYGRTALYGSLEELRSVHAEAVQDADLVVVGSYVPEGAHVGRWVQETARGVKAFYDIDTPVTLAALARGACEYLVPELIPGYDLYLSFTGGPTLAHLETVLGSPCARAFYCLVDEQAYAPQDVPRRWALGYLGTWSADRQPVLDELLVEPARRLPGQAFVVAGPQYPEDIAWPASVSRIEHLPPAEHGAFYNAQRLTLNVTRADMVRAGWSPSVRLFEAAACGVPVVSDWWEGLDTFFTPGTEILVARSATEVVEHLAHVDDERRDQIGAAARARVLAQHTAEHRVDELEEHVAQVRERSARHGLRVGDGGGQSGQRSGSDGREVPRMQTTTSERAALEQHGYCVLRSAAPPDAVATALRRLHLAIRHHGLSSEEISTCQNTTFFPHLRWEPEIWGVLPPMAAELLGWREGDDWADPQILLRFPDEAQPWTYEPHVDALPPGLEDRSYRGIVGVALTAAGAEDGVACVYPGSHRGDPGEMTPVPLQAGDALVMHPQLGHTGTLNLGPTIRTAVYFRLVAGPGRGA
jgi:spore maturation protein CgeB